VTRSSESGTPHRPTRVFYLHGFASSSRSTKAAFFTERLQAHGVAVLRPDFNQPDFATLTMTRMLDLLAVEIEQGGDGPVTLIGSSLGGTLAILAAARMADRIDRVVLMAPAVMFAKEGHHLLPPERVERWREDGSMPFFHYAYDAERQLNFAFYEDSLSYDAFAAPFVQPTLVFQGLHDISVDHRTVEAFARAHANVSLTLLDDDHQLIASLPRMWSDVERFLGLGE
jgi:pimeloyl-ACP methyl ester carboxylesterase